MDKYACGSTSWLSLLCHLPVLFDVVCCIVLWILMWMWVQLDGCCWVASLTMNLWGHHSEDWGSLVTVHSSGVGSVLSQGRRGRRHDYLLVHPLATTLREKYGIEPHINFRTFVSEEDRKSKGTRSRRIKVALFLAVSPNSLHDTSNI